MYLASRSTQLYAKKSVQIYDKYIYNCPFYSHISIKICTFGVLKYRGY